jgi:hypothetical protein
VSLALLASRRRFIALAVNFSFSVTRPAPLALPLATLCGADASPSFRPSAEP